MKSFAALLIVVMVWFVGLLAFTSRVEQSTPPAEPPVSDGVVVLTGASNVRLGGGDQAAGSRQGQAPADLGRQPRGLARGRAGRDQGRRGRSTTAASTWATRPPTPSATPARSAEWAKAKDYHSLIVVTADYHMPRSMLELHAAMPDVTLHAYPVVTESSNAHRWWKGGTSARRMIVEYCKYLAILGREAFLSLGPKEKADGRAGDPAKEAS